MRVSNGAFFIAVIAIVVATVVCSVGAYGTAQRFAVDLGTSGVQFASADGFDSFVALQPTATLTSAPPTATLRPNETPQPTLTPTPVTPTPTVDPMAGYTWDDPRRLNVLVMGIDQRQGEQGPFRTDTMMIVSIDPARQTVGMLSIPRDLWVPIPGCPTQRINTANSCGDSNGYPGGGPALAARTVSENLGVNIDRYIRINFDVFDAVVNLLAPEGVEVCPAEPIDDSTYPDGSFGFITIHFDAGCQRLRATELLQYARTRHTQGGDFDRATRQQEVLKSLREEVLSAGGVVRFITQIPALYEELSGAYVTDFTLQELLSLADLAQDIPRENIYSGVIDNYYTSMTTTAAGEQVLTPNYRAIRTLMDEVFNPQPQLSLAELQERAAEEGATVVVFNNTTINGLAGQTRDWLVGQQINVVTVGSVPTPNNATTVIRHYTGNVWTARYLAALMGLSSDVIEPGQDGATTEDIAVVAGSDMPGIIAGGAAGA